MTVDILFIALIVLLVGLAIVFLVATRRPLDEQEPSSARAAPEKPVMKQLLTPREQDMFKRLVQTFPSHIVLAQVSQGALLDAKTRAARNKFDRKITDFMILNESFAPLVVLELDDASHRNKGVQDDERDQVFADAGYGVLRLRSIPETQDLHRLVAQASKPGTVLRA